MARISPCFAAVFIASLGGCASAPAIETAVQGTLPAGRTYALVDAARYYGGADLPVAAVAQCLARAGMAPAAGGQVLVHLSGTVRPVSSRLIVGDEAKGRKSRSAQDREELVLGVTDAASGALVLRAAAARVLPRGGQPGADDALPQALCGVIAGPAAATR